MTDPVPASAGATALPPFLYPLPAVHQPRWLAGLRTQGFDAYRSHGLPGRKNEAWRYTDLSHLAETAFVPTADVSLTAADLNALADIPQNVPCAVIVNGHLDESLSRLDSLQDGLRVFSTTLCTADRHWQALLDRPQARAAIDDLPMVALNTALFGPLVVVRVQKDVRVDKPLFIVSVDVSGDRPTFSLPRVLVHLKDGAHLSVFETVTGPEGPERFTNSVTDVCLGTSARLSVVRLFRQPSGVSRVDTVLADIAAEARFETTSLILGGRLTRHEVHAALGGERAYAEIRGAYGVRSGQMVDNTVTIDHQAKKAASNQFFNGVLDGTGRAAFQGRITVHRGARGTDGRQLHNALLLSAGAEVDIKPELFIYNDDVACSHGATAGALDEDALFYLRSRGLSREDARSLLVDAFLAEALDTVADPDQHRRLITALAAWRKETGS